MNKIYVQDIKEISRQIKTIFPESVRGSISKSRWDRGARTLHLSYHVNSDTVGGYKIKPLKNLYCLISWDTNNGENIIFAEAEKDTFVKKIKKYFKGEIYRITKMVNLNDICKGDPNAKG
jgi:hypothetical protein